MPRRAQRLEALDLTARLVGETIVFRLRFANLTAAPTQAHIHFGGVAQSGGVSAWLCDSATNPAIAAAVASGALSCGQWPVASSVTSVLPGMWAWTYAPTSGGAMASCRHCSTSVGTVTFARSARLSDRNVVRANTRATSGSVRQKLLVSSSPSSGRSGLPMITGAIAADQPR